MFTFFNDVHLYTYITDTFKVLQCLFVQIWYMTIMFDKYNTKVTLTLDYTSALVVRFNCLWRFVFVVHKKHQIFVKICLASVSLKTYIFQDFRDIPRCPFQNFKEIMKIYLHCWHQFYKYLFSWYDFEAK